MKRLKKILIVIALFLAALFGFSEEAQDKAVAGFSTVRGFSTKSVSGLSLGGGTLTGDLTVIASASFGATASASLVDFQFNSLGTTSIGFESGDGLGTCFELRDQTGTIVYARFTSTAIVVNTESCK